MLRFVTPCRGASSSRRFGDGYSVHLQGEENSRVFETSRTVCLSTRFDVQELNIPKKGTKSSGEIPC